MKPQLIATAPKGTPILVYLPNPTPLWVQAEGDGDEFFDESGNPIAASYGDEPTHWIPLPEPPKPVPVYRFLEVGDIIEPNDEVYVPESGEWQTYRNSVGWPYTGDFPVRRQVTVI